MHCAGGWPAHPFLSRARGPVSGALHYTIEGLGTEVEPHPLQRAFIEHDGFQCGYCTPGQICSALGMLAEYEAGMPSVVTESTETRGLSEAEVRERMSGNLCRCGAYNGILDAIMDVAGKDTR